MKDLLKFQFFFGQKFPRRWESSDSLLTWVSVVCGTNTGGRELADNEDKIWCIEGWWLRNLPHPWYQLTVGRALDELEVITTNQSFSGPTLNLEIILISIEESGTNFSLACLATQDFFSRNSLFYELVDTKEGRGRGSKSEFPAHKKFWKFLYFEGNFIFHWNDDINFLCFLHFTPPSWMDGD